MRVLILGSGGAAGRMLTSCIKDEVYTVGTDADLFNLALSTTHESHLFPRCYHPDYVEMVEKIIKDKKIDLVFVQNDVEVEVLADKLDEMEVAHFLPDSMTVDWCQDKYVCGKFLGEKLAPKNYTNLFQLKYPLWMRAKKGAGGKGSLKVNGYMDIVAWKHVNPEITSWQYAEYMKGDNIGCDVYIENGKILCYFMKKRLRYFDGKSMSGITGSSDIAEIIDNKRILSIVKKAIKELDLDYGLYGFDLKGSKITEINPGRFLTGSIIGFKLTGFNFPMALIKYKQTGDKSVFKDLEKFRNVGAITYRQLDAEPVLKVKDND